jgi:hypothetical protein
MQARGDSDCVTQVLFRSLACELMWLQLQTTATMLESEQHGQPVDFESRHAKDDGCVGDDIAKEETDCGQPFRRSSMAVSSLVIIRGVSKCAGGTWKGQKAMPFTQLCVTTSLCALRWSTAALWWSRIRTGTLDALHHGSLL